MSEVAFVVACVGYLVFLALVLLWNHGAHGAHRPLPKEPDRSPPRTPTPLPDPLDFVEVPDTVPASWGRYRGADGL